MKKIRLLTIALAMLVATAFATEATAQRIIKLSQSPTELDVRQAISVEIIASNKDEMHVSGAQRDLDHFTYREKRGSLTLERARFNSYKNCGEIRVKLYLKDYNRLEELDVSGASKVTFKDKLNSRKLSIDVSGASKVDANGDINKLEIELSGASKISIDGTFTDVELDVSGASKLSINGDFDRMETDLSGASKIDYRGRGNRAELDVSGSSYFDGTKCFVKNAELEASGVSKISICADKYSVDSSGLSKINVQPYK